MFGRDRGGFVPNGRLSPRVLLRVVRASDAVLDAVDLAMTTYRLSGRARARLLRLARTLADLDDRADVTPDDVLEAASLRRAEGLLGD